jgi:hypothetical protein
MRDRTNQLITTVRSLNHERSARISAQKKKIREIQTKKEEILTKIYPWNEIKAKIKWLEHDVREKFIIDLLHSCPFAHLHIPHIKMMKEFSSYGPHARTYLGICCSQWLEPFCVVLWRREWREKEVKENKKGYKWFHYWYRNFYWEQWTLKI